MQVASSSQTQPTNRLGSKVGTMFGLSLVPGPRISAASRKGSYKKNLVTETN